MDESALYAEGTGAGPLKKASLGRWKLQGNVDIESFQARGLPEV